MAHKTSWVILCPNHLSEESSDTIQLNLIGIGVLGVHTFPKSISLDVNVMAWLEIEPAYFDIAVKQFSHYCTCVSEVGQSVGWLIVSLVGWLVGWLILGHDKRAWFIYSQNQFLKTIIWFQVNKDNNLL